MSITLDVLSRPAFKNRPLNPYNARINEQLGGFGVRVFEYRPHRPLIEHYDVLHVHWPETTFNHDVLSAAATTESLLLAMRVARAKGTKTVWTAHNLYAQEHRYPKWEAHFWRRYIPQVDGVIALTEDGLERTRETFPGLDTRPGWVLPHPHYRGAYPDTISDEEARARLSLPPNAEVLVFFGQILDYKNVPALVRAFRTMSGGPKPRHLVVAGRPRSRELELAVRHAARGADRVHLHLRYVPDSDVQMFLRAADLVVLPYKEILNSGSAVLGLSFDRRVCMPCTGAAPSLRSVVGERWMHLYDELGPESLAAALEGVGDLPRRTDGAHLGGISPMAIAESTAAIYRELLGSR